MGLSWMKTKTTFYDRRTYALITTSMITVPLVKHWRQKDHFESKGKENRNDRLFIHLEFKTLRNRLMRQQYSPFMNIHAISLPPSTSLKINEAIKVIHYFFVILLPEGRN